MRKLTEPKQIIVIRKDLDMPPGKLAAQVAHASLGAVFLGFNKIDNIMSLDLNGEDGSPGALEKWIQGRFTKVVLYVKSEQALMNIYEKAQDKGLPSVLIEDAGFTVFKESTLTCVGIGPCYPEKFIGVTDKLRVL